MLKKLILLNLIFINTLQLFADEGMWLPLLLEQKNQAEMQSLGLRLSAEDIYSVNHSSLKDAIVHFGGGCTGEVVSDQGLILTNHHCGYGQIQARSTIENDYLTNGFWASSLQEELPNPGLTVSFLIEMKDVTAAVFQGINNNMSLSEKNRKKNANIAAIKKEATSGNHYEATVRPYYYGNEYYLLVYETFTDIRLVGAPPSNIGKFGGDTDNWMWPRHTGDFSVFRIYAGSDNKPAPFSKENVPFKPRKHLTISLRGVQPDDFTFVYGFPGRTEEYLPSLGVDLAVNTINPIRIALRGIRLGIISKYSETNDTIRLQYAAKHAGIANGWKKWIGESNGIKQLRGVEKKKEYETRFAAWAGTDEADPTPYSELLASFESAYKPYTYWKSTETWLSESVMSVEALKLARAFTPLAEICANRDSSEAAIKTLSENYIKSIDGFFKNYNSRIDREIFVAMLRMYMEAGSQKTNYPEILNTQLKKFNGSYQAMADHFFETSLFADKNRISSMLQSFTRKSIKKIEKDPFYILGIELEKYQREKVAPAIRAFNRTFDSLMPIYMKAQMEMEPSKRFYPDANSTLRVSYGKVAGYTPFDGVNYNYYTTLDGIIEKENPEVYDYVVEPRLKELFLAKDFGPYADASGEMRTCFIATNHTSGGNSGSPVMNSNGELIGINFDRCWEGTMSDLMYSPDRCRNISLDIRYCLFIIDKLAGARHLIDEMTIVH